jgi:hypothetical protein
MAFITADRVLEKSSTTGTGSYTLSGTLPGFVTFSSVCSNGDTCVYYSEDVDANGIPSGDWEIGVGTWGTGGTLDRTQILTSSNANSAVSWGTGTRRIAITLDTSQIIANKYAYTVSSTAPTPQRFGHIWTNNTNNVTSIWNDDGAGGSWIVPNTNSTVFSGAPTVPNQFGDASSKIANTNTVLNLCIGLLGSYATLASPALTGTPTAPTAAVATNTTQIATTAFVKAQAYATLASPTLTGTPVAPTATTATNTTQIATTAFVKAQAYATLASPALTGTPTAPTAPTSTNSTQIATTAFVKAQGFASLASPAFTGSPTATTAAPNTFTDQIATTAFVMNQGYITGGSPVLSGTPTAPTPSYNDNSTQIATTAFVLGRHTFNLAQSVTPFALTSGTTISINAANSNYYTLTLNTNATLANPTFLVAGTVYIFIIRQDATGGRTLAFDTLYKFPSNANTALSTTPSAVDMLSAYYDGTVLLCSLATTFS